MKACLKNDRVKEFAMWWSVMMIIALCATFYTNYRFNHMIIAEHIYVVDKIEDDAWHFSSETGQNIIVTNNDGGEIYWYVSDLNMTIGGVAYPIQRDYNRKTTNTSFFIELNDQKIDVSRTASLIDSKPRNIVFILIIFYLLITTLLCINIIFPEASWKVRTAFVTRGGEPTEFYLNFIRIISLLLWVFAVFKISTIV